MNTQICGIQLSVFHITDKTKWQATRIFFVVVLYDYPLQEDKFLKTELVINLLLK